MAALGGVPCRKEQTTMELKVGRSIALPLSPEEFYPMIKRCALGPDLRADEFSGTTGLCDDLQREWSHNSRQHGPPLES